MKKGILVLFMCFLFGTTAYAKDISELGDVKSIDFEMKPQSKMEIVQDIPLPATFAVDTWGGILDTDFASIQNKQNQLFDNDINTGIEIKNIQTQTIEFKESIVVSKIRYAAQYIQDGSSGSGNLGRIYFNLYDDKGILVSTKNLDIRNASFNTGYITVDLMNIKKVVLGVAYPNAGYIKTKINEIEIFSDETVTYDSVSDVFVTSTVDSIDVTYKNPSSKFVSGNIIKINGRTVHNGGKIGEYQFKELEENKLYKIEIAAVYYDGTQIWTNMDIKTKTNKPDKPGDVTNLKANLLNNEIVLSYEKPENADYVMIYKDSKLVADQHKSNSFIDKDFTEEKTYYYKVVAVNDGGQSNGVQVSIKIPGKEVTKLRSETKSNEVNLYWEVPIYENFDMVMIYRLKKEEKGFFARLLSSPVYEPLFQTNGTYFKDMTVRPDTQYEYKLSTVDTKGNETPGVTIKVQTQKVTVGGSEIEKDENGDYVITWKTPTTGKMKVLVGGKEYTTVPASDKKVVIPKDKMVFDIVGNPDVKLIPIDEDGNAGEPSKPGVGPGTGNGGGIGDIVGGGDLAEVLNPENTIKAGIQLLALVGLFLLLGLAFRIVPKLINMIRNAFLNKKNENIYGGRRRVEE